MLKLVSKKTIQRLIELNCPDVGNVRVTAITIIMMRIRLYAVNSSEMAPKERVALEYSSLIWYTSFAMSASTMITNKRNIATESIALVFIMLRSDVLRPRHCTSEPLEHTYGSWRTIQREFNVLKMI